MFYSQTFLARKGPLGPVWCAAHLQHRLKKSHYTSTDISSTVDRIMFPEVPIALRMSGHLLLGVVRIYSKKVDYLYHDCNVALIELRKAFAASEVNLPENAKTAKFESVTLPQTFDLDALDVYFDIDPDGLHTRSEEEITLQDQIPTNRDTYVVVTFDEEMMDIFPPEQDPNSGVRQMEGILLQAGVDDLTSPTSIPSSQMKMPEGTVLQDPGPSNQTQVAMDTIDLADPAFQTEVPHTSPDVDNSPPGIEVRRDPVPGFSQENLPPLFLDHQTGEFVTKSSSDHGLDEKGTPPFEEDALPSGRQSSASHQHLRSPDVIHSSEAPESFNRNVSFGHNLPELALDSTPPVQQSRPRRRKRKNFFDESTVLTNRFMKKALENSNDILRKRREIPSTSLGIWKMNNTLRKEQVLHEPSLTGSCADICNLFKKDYISTKPHLTLERGVTPEPSIVASPAPETEPTHGFNDGSPAPAAEVIPEARDTTSLPAGIEVFEEPRNASLPVPATTGIPEPAIRQSSSHEAESYPERECLRHNEGPDGNNVLPELLSSPARVMHSFRSDDFTPSSPKSFVSEPVTWAGTSTGTSLLNTADIAASTGTYPTEPETPRTFLEEQFDVGHTGLSDIPESANVAETEDLSFLEADNSPAGSQGTLGIDSLSVRTRATAQYLVSHSPNAWMSEERGYLSLNKILQGKTRKLCARMFFEMLSTKRIYMLPYYPLQTSLLMLILRQFVFLLQSLRHAHVLKSYNLIDVQQEQPYGDIALKLMSNLAKSQI